MSYGVCTRELNLWNQTRISISYYFRAAWCYYLIEICQFNEVLVLCPFHLSEYCEVSSSWNTRNSRKSNSRLNSCNTCYIQFRIFFLPNSCLKKKMKVKQAVISHAVQGTMEFILVSTLKAECWGKYWAWNRKREKQKDGNWYEYISQIRSFKICTFQVINYDEFMRKDEIGGVYKIHVEDKKRV
jgi:hypothetical protein